MIQSCHAGEIAFRPAHVGDNSKLNRVASYTEYDRNCRSCSLCCKCCRSAAGRGNHSHPTTNQICGQCWQSIIVTLCPAVFDCHVSAVDVPHFAQARMERTHTTRPKVKRFAAE